MLRPFLEVCYECVRHYPGFDTTGMTTLDQIHNQPIPPDDPTDPGTVVDRQRHQD
jgi:hypothetical protein